MSNKSTDGQNPALSAEQFKTQQRQMWNNVAAGWQAWWPTFEQGAQKVSDRLVELAEIGQGDKVLDIATGIGEPAVTAAKKVSPDGSVVAADISSQMISIAKSRAKSLGLDSIIEFRESDAESLDFLPKSSFDAVLSRWGLMFLPNLASALTAIRDLLVPGGRFAAAVWPAPSKVPVLDLAFSNIRKQINAPAPQPGTPGPFALADSESLKVFFKQAGFEDIRIQALDITFTFDSAASFTRFHQQVSAPLQAMLANHNEETKHRAWDSVTDAASRYADSHGRVSIDNEVICAVATKP